MTVTATSILDARLVAMLPVLGLLMLSPVPLQESPSSEESPPTQGPITTNHCRVEVMKTRPPCLRQDNSEDSSWLPVESAETFAATTLGFDFSFCQVLLSSLPLQMLSPDSPINSLKANLCRRVISLDRRSSFKQVPHEVLHER